MQNKSESINTSDDPDQEALIPASDRATQNSPDKPSISRTHYLNPTSDSVNNPMDEASLKSNPIFYGFKVAFVCMLVLGMITLSYKSIHVHKEKVY